ncbi:Phosphoserine phosphatase [hydrothermal vent metagenome]|uniref:phosphoserine phosphatase n=1 Tax=hydrothermal vent metagenome TaxID=652676 RepID=A0A3B0Z7M2_9ZZZZ
MAKLILQGSNLTQQAVQEISTKLKGKASHFETYSRIDVATATAHDQLNEFRQNYAFDINLIPESFAGAQAKLLMTDMDSTLISIECIDEIGDFLGIKKQISEITESTMRGEIGFETSLTQRVALLAGLETSVLERVYQERLKLNPGAKLLAKVLKQHNIKIALVSGGFTYFTDRLKTRLELDYTLANTLEQKDNKLTGKVVGSIVGAQAKADLLLQLTKNLNIAPAQTIALGDGANDLNMMKEAGLSIAYHAKPTVQQQALTTLNYTGLEGVLGLLEIDVH